MRSTLSRGIVAVAMLPSRVDIAVDMLTAEPGTLTVAAVTLGVPVVRGRINVLEEGDALDELHHDVETASENEAVVVLDDVRVRYRAQDAHFFRKGCRDELILCIMRVVHHR